MTMTREQAEWIISGIERKLDADDAFDNFDFSAVENLAIYVRQLEAELQAEKDAHYLDGENKRSAADEKRLRELAAENATLRADRERLAEIGRRIPSLLFERDEPFDFADEPGEHDPCYVVMPGGQCLELNHDARPGVDIARAHFILDACNAVRDAARQP